VPADVSRLGHTVEHQEIRLHPLDAISVRLWVDRFRDNDTLVFYKDRADQPPVERSAFARARRPALSSSDHIAVYRLALAPGPFSTFSTVVSPFSSIPHVSLAFSSRTLILALSTVRSLPRCNAPSWALS
jgi:hypothetical protein